MSEELKIYEEKMNKSIQNLQADLSTVRTGRANPKILDKVKVDAYGMQMPLNQLGNISTPEARLIQINPFDITILKAIEKGIIAADLGLNPTNDGKVIRIVFPELTEELRKSITKDVKKKGEDCKVAIRNIRRDAIDNFKKQQKANEITEDELKQLEDDIQKSTNKFISEVDRTVESKNKDVLSI